MDRQYTLVEEQVEYGLDTVDASRTVEVPLRDLLYVYHTIGEFVRFFHNRAHYPNTADVHKFIGNKDAGALHLLCECYYRRLRDVVPEDISAEYDGGSLDNPTFPYYYERPDKGPA